MDDLQNQIDDIVSNLDDLSSTTDDQSSTLDDQSNVLDDHESRISGNEDTLSNIDTDLIGQLDFPLNEDSILRIQEVFPKGTFTLVSGQYNLVDNRIGINSLILYSVVTTAGVPNIAVGNTHLSYNYALSAGAALFTSTFNTDVSTLAYVIYN